MLQNRSIEFPLRSACAVLLLSLCANGCIFVAATTAVGTGAGAVMGVVRHPDDSLPNDGIPVGAAIRVTHSNPRDVGAVKPGTTDTIWLRGSQILTGRIQGARGDTILLSVTQASLSNGRRETFRRGTLIAAIPRSRENTVEVLSMRPGLSESVLAGMGAGFLFALVVGVIICSNGACDGG